MIGCPGSGKSTLTSKKYPDLPQVSRDIIRAELGFIKPGVKAVCTPAQEQAVTKAQEEKIKGYISAGQDFVLDDTNVNQKYLKISLRNVRNWAKKVGQDLHLIAEVFKVPAEVCFERRKADGFDFETIDRMYKAAATIPFGSGDFTFSEVHFHTNH